MRKLMLVLASAGLAACSDGSTSDSDPSYSPPGENSTSGMTAEQENKYDNLSSEGQDYVDEQMKQYDEHCANSSDC
ncbi:hypothetical protein [Parasphingorhabdus sp.]|uniref:hypothetical protein n=1 Tax=Parasphingorhabdus sp. TaxID=2709688 RepID=UPI0030027149